MLLAPALLLHFGAGFRRAELSRLLWYRLGVMGATCCLQALAGARGCAPTGWALCPRCRARGARPDRT